jgi:hypothetical protein
MEFVAFHFPGKLSSCAQPQVVPPFSYCTFKFNIMKGKGIKVLFSAKNHVW